MKYEVPEDEALGLAQGDVPPVPTGVGDPVTGIGDVARMAKYGTCTHAGSPSRALMRMANSH